MPSSCGAKYETWVQNVLGERPPYRKWFENPVTGAIAADGENFAFFRERFRERVLRLWNGLPQDRVKILEKVANVGTQNWYGYFAELTAWDFFAAIPVGLQIEVEPPGTQLGTGTSILDGRLTRVWNVHFDVKALADTTAMVLEGIERDLKDEFPGYVFRFNYAHDLGQTVVSDVRQDLVDKIRSAVKHALPYVFHAQSNITVRIYNAAPGVTSTEHSYDPFAQARELRFSVLSDAKQFIRNERNILVFVVHPWFNLTHADNFADHRNTFFRALARRAFCELTKDSRQLTEVVRRAPAGVTIQFAAQHLSGIVFLVDHSIVGRNKRDFRSIAGVLEAFIYVNPNAAEDSNGQLQLEQIQDNAVGLVSDFDDFSFDNY